MSGKRPSVDRPLGRAVRHSALLLAAGARRCGTLVGGRIEAGTLARWVWGRDWPPSLLRGVRVAGHCRGPEDVVLCSCRPRARMQDDVGVFVERVTARHGSRRRSGISWADGLRHVSSDDGPLGVHPLEVTALPVAKSSFKESKAGVRQAPAPHRREMQCGARLRKLRAG
jgi:hypothetical protein